MNRIYLDNAATSWPKPEDVYAAVDGYLRTNGAPAGRSVYSQAGEVEEAVASARAAIARLIGASDARQIIFTANCTEALNLAIHGLLQPGDHAVCTAADHNSLLRPLKFLEERGKIEVTARPLRLRRAGRSRRCPSRVATEYTVGRHDSGFECNRSDRAGFANR